MGFSYWILVLSVNAVFIQEEGFEMNHLTIFLLGLGFIVQGLCLHWLSKTMKILAEVCDWIAKQEEAK